MQKTKEIPRVELLAPVGKWDVLEAVIRAGADAVYLGGKKFNMRLHRKEFNFTREQMRDAAVYCHEKGVKIYVTVNNMLTDAETAEIPDYLSYLQKIAVDGLIVQDLGVVRWAKKMGLTVPLHGSVMMNVHNLESIQLLEELGLTRVILGRELTLDDIKLIHNKTSLELEYFTHGDMCFSQSSQCYHSGMLFGKSSNRGQCLKPCRWAFELVDRETDEVIPVQVPGHYFMAVKDITLLPFLPDVIDSGICSLKLEG
ncbi:MAG: U32 family peptidase, partial [Syntrophaceticus sp.]|nr:U32 family peptidase [Syntrophaceticus sp.]